MPLSSVLRAGQEQGSAQIMENPSFRESFYTCSEGWEAKICRILCCGGAARIFTKSWQWYQSSGEREQQEDAGASSSKEEKVHTLCGFSISFLG